jgi:aspartyl aminopeptidase
MNADDSGPGLALSDAHDLCAFVNASPTPFHAAAESARRLFEAGFRDLDEREPWTLSPGDKRYVVRGGSTILAFVVGDASPASAGFRMIGAHTDSPCLRVKPNADISTKGYQQLGVEVYGGVLLSTWMDRDLSLAGRVLLAFSGAVTAWLVDLGRAVARVPNLAIHLNRDVNKEGLVLNAQKHLPPVIGLGKEPALKAMLASALDVKLESILGYDLSLYDTAGARLGGLDDAFIFSPRLDNLGSCHAATRALIAASAVRSSATRLIVLYDHEECGSRSAVGAAGTSLRDTVTRIIEAHPDKQPQALGRAMARSYLVSADMAHAVHPNYEAMHEPMHQPVLNQGLVIKSNVNQSYATDGATAAEFAGICRDAGYEAQRFVVRTDLPCGSTIGPITAAELGVKTVDVGAPMLSMHSCREMAGSLDVKMAIDAFTRALK